MEFDPEVHVIKCPKCGHGMDEISYGGDLLIDRCTGCQGMWFDHGEAEQLKGKWMGDALDVGDADKGIMSLMVFALCKDRLVRGDDW